jgi:hypothetical protein
MGQKSKYIIGIAGNALTGKDTLCKAMIEVFGKRFGIKSSRRSIAGDQVRKDLEDLVWDKFGIDVNTPTNEEKTLIRDLMVHYGRIQRTLTNGRYFIDKFERSEYIDIVPDIRYAEYERDELYWIKNDMNGFLIFLERDGISPANVYEETNNKIVKSQSDYVVNCPTFSSDVLESEMLKIARTVINEWLKFIKI